MDLHVFYAHNQSSTDQAKAGFGNAFDWDIDLFSDYNYKFLINRSLKPSVNNYFGCDTPGIYNEVRDGGFDVFLITGWYLRCYWQAVSASHRIGIPVMVRGDSQLTTPRSRVKKIVKEIVYPKLLQYFDAYLYVGIKNKEYLEHYKVQSEKLFFSPHCIDNEWFSDKASNTDVQEVRKRLGCRQGYHLVLFVGKFLENKRAMDVVKSLEILKNEGMNVHGVFVGSGELELSLRDAVVRANLSAIFTGFLNQSELPEVYASADLLVLPSASETWGLVVNEALACGTPVVVSNAVGCAPDLVDDGNTGAVYPVGDISTMADAIKRVLTTPLNSTAIKQKIRTYSLNIASNGIVDAAGMLASENASKGILGR